jgi:general secretion pathway protein A
MVVDRALREPRPALATPAKPSVPILSPARNAPLMGPAKPPIRVEEGLIEVGWSPEAESTPGEVEDPLPAPAPALNGHGEQRIDDPYAALQAWHEWATNQGRHPALEPAAPPEVPPLRRDEEALTTAAPARVWADEEHGFAPFGRLFTRVPQENEAE